MVDSSGISNGTNHLPNLYPNYGMALIQTMDQKMIQLNLNTGINIILPSITFLVGFVVGYWLRGLPAGPEAMS